MISAKWNKFKLGDIAQIVGGGTPSTSKPEYWGGDIPWVTPRDLSFSDERFVSHGERSITEEGLKNSSTKVLPKGAVLLTTRAPIGYLRIAQNPICTNQGFKSLIPDEEVVNSHFLYYLLRNNVEYLKSVGVGSTFAEISGSALSRLEFMFPPLETQEKIVEILSALDEKIELNRQTNATLEAIAQAIFKEWFIDFNFPGATGEMVSSPLGPIPKGWKLGKLGDFVSITSGKGIQKNKLGRKGYPVLGANGIIGESDEYLLNKEAILTGRVGTLGTFQLVNEKVWVTDNVLILQPLNHKNFHYTYHWVQQIDFQNLNRGSTQPLITKRDLLDQALLVPERVVIEGFDTTCRIFYSLINENEKQSISLQNIRNNLLPKLMEGEF